MVNSRSRFKDAGEPLCCHDDGSRMTLVSLPVAEQDTGVVNAEDFVQRLIGRSHLERDDDLEHGEFGLRDLRTGVRVHVPVPELTHYAAAIRERMSLLREQP